MDWRGSNVASHERGLRVGHTLGVLRFDLELSELTQEQRAGLEGAEVESGGRYLNWRRSIA